MTAFRLENFVRSLENLPVRKDKKYLLACSGGCDSMVLACLLSEAGIDFEAAHVNYGLRGEESDGDEALVRDFFSEKGILLHVFHPVDEFKEKKGESVQMIARELRYGWFWQLLEENGLEAVFTGHHQNDQAETVLLNLSRGTGLRGLRGMLPVQGKVLRPLLDFSRQELYEYAGRHGIPFRNDSSNSGTKYRRNYIRHEVLPVMEKLNPRLVEHIAETARISAGAWQMLEGVLEKKKRKYFLGNGRYSRSLAGEEQAGLLLYYILEPYGLEKYTGQILSPHTVTGAVFLSSEYMLLADREYWLVRKRNQASLPEARLYTGKMLRWGSWEIRAEVADLAEEFPPVSAGAWISAENLQWPLIVRPWKQGDAMQPLGMKGKKKLSDIFTEAKVSRFEKSSIPVICSGSEIICVSGFRVSELYKAKSPGKNIFITYRSLSGEEVF
jgi:tRNA(Ile)-lysidine synthase